MINVVVLLYRDSYFFYNMVQLCGIFKFYLSWKKSLK